MSALSRRGDLLEVDVARSVWTRGGRPLGGMLLRFGFAGVFLMLGLVIAEPVTRIIFIVSGVAVLLGLQPLMDRRLEAMGASIAASDRARASKWLGALEKQRIVTLFAPHAWVALQRGRLHLVLGNGRAAAKALADCARISGQTDLPALVSGQAHGLLLAGDRKDARSLLATLEGKGALSPRDRLDLGIALLEEAGRSNAARAQLEAAREQLGGHPRVLAGLALALARSDAPAEALPILEAAQTGEEAERDELAAELIKRARKTLRPAIEAAEKRERKARAAAEQAARSAAARTAPASEARSDKRSEKKRDRRKERREKRRGEDKPSVSKPTAATGAAEAEAKQRAEAEAKQRADAEAKQRADVEAKQRAEAEAKQRADAEAKQRADADAQQRADAERQRAAEAEAKRRAEEEAAAERRAAEADAAARRRAEEEAAAAARRTDEAAAAARRRAEEEAARARIEAEARRAAELEAQRRLEEEAARRREAAAGPTPTFMPPPMPPASAKPIATTVVAPPSVATPPSIATPPSVAAPPVAASAPVAPAIDASGWDDLLGDVPPPAAVEPKKS